MQKPLVGFDGDTPPVSTSSNAPPPPSPLLPPPPSSPPTLPETSRPQSSSASSDGARSPSLAGPELTLTCARRQKKPPSSSASTASTAASPPLDVQPSAARSRRSTTEKPNGKLPPRHGFVYTAPIAPPLAVSASTSSSSTSSSSTVSCPPAASSSLSSLSSLPPLVSASYASDRSTSNNSYHYSSDDNGDDSTAHSIAKFAGCLANTLIMDKPLRPRPAVRRQPSRNPWSISCLALSISLLGAALLALIFHSLVTRETDPKGCRMAYMYPSYTRLSDFDTEHTRFASKYSLYLYREDGFDDKTKLRGIPVLFIPGNAGSYKQVRPIAGEAAQYFHNVVQHDEAALRAGARTLDFFTVDFNEDITAFHGQTMLDQAEYLNEAIRYILSLYLDPSVSARYSNLPDPTSVIVLGHSMGGIVARTMLIMPNYQSNSINTIITLSAPHARPPVTFDGEIVKIYDDINDYWRHAYSQKWANNNPLWHVTLVSIAGGGLDTVVPSDYASVESIVPETHGFTVFTTTIPDVWTSMDHQAILWCDQFRKAISRTLFDLVDVHRATQTRPRAERMRVFRKHFLTGLEPAAEKDMPFKEHATLLTLDDNYSTIIAQGERLVLRHLGISPRPQAHLLPVPPPGSPVSKRFTLLTDQRLAGPGDTAKIDVLFCSVFPLQSGQSGGVFPIKLDLSGETTGSTRLACKNATQDVVSLPASRRFSHYPFSLDERDAAPFSYLQYDIEQVVDHQFVAVIDKATVPTPGFLVAEFSDNDQARTVHHANLQSLLTLGLHVHMPANRPMVNEIQIPAIQSSLLAYHLDISSPPCGHNSASAASAELFMPLVRQHLSEPFESKFYVNAQHVSVSLHGVAPYMPPVLTPSPPDEAGLGFQFWTDPTCNASMEVRLTVDVMGSMGKLYMRYRTVFAAFPVVIAALVLQKQFRVYDDTGVFMSFSEGLDNCLRKSIPLVLASLTLMALSVGNSQGTPPSTGFLPWHNATLSGIDFHKNDLLVGTQDPFFWLLTPLIGLICIGVCTALNYFTLALTHLLSIALSLALSRPAWLRHDGRRRAQQVANQSSSGSGSGSGNSGAGAGAGGGEGQQARSATQPLQPLQQLQQLQQMQTQLYFAPPFIQSSPRRRVVTTMVLLLLVTTFIPYQFAYLVACMIQLGTTVRALRVASDLRSTINYNFYNYVHSVLVLMLWILPINLPILVVWIRNLAVRWLTPFSSHHNVLSIMPFILLVETLTTGRMVPRITTSLRHITSILLFGVAIASAVYGVSYAYMIHHLVNVVVAWLVIVHSAGEPDTWSVTLLSGIFDDVGDGKQGKTP